MKTNLMKTKWFACLVLCCLYLLFSAGEAFGQRPDRPVRPDRGQRPQATAPQDQQKTDEAAAAEKKKEDEKPEPAPVKLTAIVGGEIHTATGEVIRRGTILIEDDKIKAVGRNIEIPDDAEVIDATGKVISPGFVAINMSGLAVRGSITGNNKLADALDPFDRNLKYALGVGITSGCIELARGGGAGRRRGRSEEMPRFPDEWVSEMAAAATTADDLTSQNQDDDHGSIARTADDVLAKNESGETPREVTLEELLGYTLREGEPEHRFLGIDPEIGQFVTESQLDYGMENTELCPCCNLPIMPTEPIEATPPTREQPRRHAAVKLSYGNLENMLVKENVFYSPSPGALSGALNRHNWRRSIKTAREELKKAENPDAGANRGNQGQAQNQGRGRAGDGQGGATEANQQQRQRQTAAAAAANRARPSNNPLFPLLKKEVSLRVTANTASEVRDMIALAEELDYDLVIEGGVEAWLAVAELSRSGAQVVYTPRRRRDAQVGLENESGSSIESTRMFESQGVPFAITPLSNAIAMGGLAGRDLTSLPLEAAFAVRGGASDLAALQSITLVPAKMMGLEDRIGSIEVGKDADILILNGDPLDYRSYVETAIVSGKICYQREIDRVYPVYDRR